MEKGKTYYVTTPIYYPSGKFHIGTAYTTILAESIVKYKKQRGYDTLFLTGLDEHGQKIQTLAKEQGKKTQDYVDEMAKHAKILWEKLDISYDIFMRTTDEVHMEVVQKIFSYFLKNDDIYLGEYSGLYCIPCETYYTERELIDGKCPACMRNVEEMTEEVYFFKMSKYKDALKKHYEENEDFILPHARKNELFNSFINEGIDDLSVTRTSFDWGVKVKENEKHVIYVWLDALTNYITALGFMTNNDERFKKFWPADLHIVGKDIIRFHGIYWPIFLMALDLPLPKQIYSHNFFMMKDSKMSKSKGNVIYPDDIAEEYGTDAIKYVLLKEMPYSHDGSFSPEGFVDTYNADLANDLGNLVQRTIGMVKSYRNGQINTNKYDETNTDIDEDILNIKDSFEEDFENFYIQKSIETIWEGVSKLNKYIDENKPWELAKGNDEDNEKLDEFLFKLVNNIRRIAILIKPFITKTSKQIFNYLNISDKLQSYDSFEEKLKDITVDVNAQPIFNRLDKEKEILHIENIVAKSKK